MYPRTGPRLSDTPKWTEFVPAGRWRRLAVRISARHIDGEKRHTTAGGHRELAEGARGEAFDEPHAAALSTGDEPKERLWFITTAFTFGAR